jgi:dihydroorotase
MPHNLCLTEEDARKLGEKSWGRVNPPLRPEEDRKALVKAVLDGTIDIIATDHAPHSAVDKEAGAPGFSGFETAFAAVYTGLTRSGFIDLKKLSSLMSARPALLLGLAEGPEKRGRLLPGYRADITIADTEAPWIVDPSIFKTRGKNSAFVGKELYGKILITISRGRVVFISL